MARPYRSFTEMVSLIFDVLAASRDYGECEICSRRAHTSLIRACGRCQHPEGRELERITVPAPSWQLLGWLASAATIVMTCIEVGIHT